MKAAFLVALGYLLLIASLTAAALDLQAVFLRLQKECGLIGAALVTTALACGWLAIIAAGFILYTDHVASVF